MFQALVPWTVLNTVEGTLALCLAMPMQRQNSANGKAAAKLQGQAQGLGTGLAVNTGERLFSCLAVFRLVPV